MKRIHMRRWASAVNNLGPVARSMVSVNQRLIPWQCIGFDQWLKLTMLRATAPWLTSHLFYLLFYYCLVSKPEEVMKIEPTTAPNVNIVNAIQDLSGFLQPIHSQVVGGKYWAAKISHN